MKSTCVGGLQYVCTYIPNLCYWHYHHKCLHVTYGVSTSHQLSNWLAECIESNYYCLWYILAGTVTENCYVAEKALETVITWDYFWSYSGTWEYTRSNLRESKIQKLPGEPIDDVCAYAHHLPPFTLMKPYFAHLSHYLDKGPLILSTIYNCDWVLENWLKCHTRPIAFYWPS